jgi:hypothetical protein
MNPSRQRSIAEREYVLTCLDVCYTLDKNAGIRPVRDGCLPNEIGKESVHNGQPNPQLYR